LLYNLQVAAFRLADLDRYLNSPHPAVSTQPPLSFASFDLTFLQGSFALFDSPDTVPKCETKSDPNWACQRKKGLHSARAGRCLKHTRNRDQHPFVFSFFNILNQKNDAVKFTIPHYNVGKARYF